MNKEYIAKLRLMVDLMEELLTPGHDVSIKKDKRNKKQKEQKAEKAITEKMNKVIADGFNELETKKEKKTAKGFKYKPGTHWTQRPENKGRLSKVIKAMYKRNKEKANAK